MRIIDLPLPFGRVRSGARMQRVRAVVVHYTGGPGGQPPAVWNTFAQLNNQPEKVPASCQYSVGLNGEVYRFIPETEEAYTSGGLQYTETARKLFWDQKRNAVYPHDKSIGIEVCHPDESGKFTPATLSALVGLCAGIVGRHRLGLDGIIRHYDVTGKLCPLYYVRNPHEWEALQRRILVASIGRQAVNLGLMAGLVIGTRKFMQTEGLKWPQDAQP